MRRALLLLLLPSLCLASGPQYVGSKTDPAVYQEFQNVYHDLSAAPSYVGGHPITKAQLQTLNLSGTPAGTLFYCSDCSTDAIAVSTGTGIGAVSRATARTTAIQ